MDKVKLIWRVDPAPTGRYRSFERRGWPSASFADEHGSRAAFILCSAEYEPAKVRTGEHPPLTIRIADYRVGDDPETRARFGTSRMLRLKQTATTLKEAKSLAQKVLDAHPELWPAHLRPKEGGDGQA